MEVIGMTGKFHTQWGAFGGFKHPNALRYESAVTLANGPRSVWATRCTRAAGLTGPHTG
jgi:hypothetical protein